MSWQVWISLVHTSYTWCIYVHISSYTAIESLSRNSSNSQVLSTHGRDGSSRLQVFTFVKRLRSENATRWCPHGRRSHSNSPVFPFQLEGGFQNSINYRYNRWYINKHIYIYICLSHEAEWIRISDESYQATWLTNWDFGRQNRGRDSMAPFEP